MFLRRTEVGQHRRTHWHVPCVLHCDSYAGIFSLLKHKHNVCCVAKMLLPDVGTVKASHSNSFSTENPKSEKEKTIEKLLC